jgi:hypothetical protein
MDEQHIQQMIEVMLACHGAEAESAARKRANRCTRRKEPEWAAAWRERCDRRPRATPQPIPAHCVLDRDWHAYGPRFRNFRHDKVHPSD